MEDHEKRVVVEMDELNEKVSKLTEFMHGDIYAGMPAVDQGLLMVQLEAMKMYLNTLIRRIERF